MTARRLKKGIAATCLAVVAIATGTAASAQSDTIVGPHTIRVLSATDDAAASPRAAVWKNAPATQVPLQTAFAGHPSIVGTAGTQKLAAQAIRSRDRLFVRLAWRDRTANTAIRDTDQFLDGAAVEFPLYGGDGTVPYMGDTVHPVNLWQWHADGSTRNLLAKGFGTSFIVPVEGLRSEAARTADGWEVVISRSLQAKAGEGTNFQGLRRIPIGFAVWDGENQERDGFKAVTMDWWYLSF